MDEQIFFGGVTVDCKDPKCLSDFYIRTLQWEKTYEDKGFICISSASCNARIGFQRNIDYVPPIWSDIPNGQRQQVHLDFKARDKEHMKSLGRILL